MPPQQGTGSTYRELPAEVQTVRTRPEDPMRYGLGWAVGPTDQMYVNGRLPGYRTALMLVPEHDLAGVVLAADSDALPAAAQILNDVQHRVTGDDIGEQIADFAASVDFESSPHAGGGGFSTTIARTREARFCQRFLSPAARASRLSRLG